MALQSSLGSPARAVAARVVVAPRARCLSLSPRAAAAGEAGKPSKKKSRASKPEPPTALPALAPPSAASAASDAPWASAAAGFPGLAGAPSAPPPPRAPAAPPAARPAAARSAEELLALLQKSGSLRLPSVTAPPHRRTRAVPGDVAVCTGKHCKKEGASALLAAFRAHAAPGVEVRECKCKGACKAAPVVQVSSPETVAQKFKRVHASEASHLLSLHNLNA